MRQPADQLVDGLLGSAPGELDIFHPYPQILQTFAETADPANYASMITTDVAMYGGLRDGCTSIEVSTHLATALGIPIANPQTRRPLYGPQALVDGTWSTGSPANLGFFAFGVAYGITLQFVLTTIVALASFLILPAVTGTAITQVLVNDGETAVIGGLTIAVSGIVCPAGLADLKGLEAGTVKGFNGIGLGAERTRYTPALSIFGIIHPQGDAFHGLVHVPLLCGLIRTRVLRWGDACG